MDASKTQDRLKAFLDRNRSRMTSSLNTESNEGFPLITMSTQPDVESKANQQFGGGGETASGALSSRQHNGGAAFRNPFGYISDRNTSYTESHNPANEGRFATDFSVEDSPKKQVRGSGIAAAPGGSQTHRETMDNPSQYQEAERGRRNYSSSPPREENKAPQNFIESFLANKKKAENKIKENLRSLSKEVPKKPLHQKNNSVVSPLRSPIARKYSESVSEAPVSARTSARRSVQREPLKVEKKPIKSQRISKPVQSGSQKKSLALNKPKEREEKHEFLFEEVQTENNKGNKSARATSRSKEPIRQKSLTPRGDRTPERKQQPTQQSHREMSQDKSPRGGKKEIFPESTKRLHAMDSNNANNESKFKKEIKKLIHIIKEEKEQITTDMEAMNKELVKYKTAYKKLKKELQQYKNASISKNKHFDDNFNNESSISRPKPKKSEDMYTPFTIDELTKHFDKNIPIHVEEDDVELLSKLNHINLDVENLTGKNISGFHTPQKDLSQNLITETHSFVLRKNDINCYIIKEMNLASHMFFQDTAKEFEEDATFKPTVIDLLAAQREIIYFMIRKIEIEEKQRLKTEEQASKMMVQMEKAIKQMDERGSVSRKRESASTTELNKSITSQN